MTFDDNSKFNAPTVEAREIIGRIPVPQCATIRKESFFWNEPTSRLRAQYPDLFKS